MSADQNILEGNLASQFQEFRLVFEKLITENDQLCKDNQLSDAQIQLSTANEKALMQELSLTKDSLASLQSTINNLSHIEEENKRLYEKIKEVDQALTATKAQTLQTTHTLHAKLCELTRQQASELVNLKKQYEAKAHNETELYRKIINDKESAAEKLLRKMSTLQNQHYEEVMQVKIEYENKLIQMQEQCSKFLQSATKPPTAGLATSSMGVDIMRRKMRNMQLKHGDEVTGLKKTISTLQEKLQQCNHHMTSLQEPSIRRKRFLFSKTTTEFHE